MKRKANYHPEASKEEIIKAIKWFTGDRYYDLEKDYLGIVNNDMRLTVVLNSYREFAQMQKLQFCK